MLPLPGTSISPSGGRPGEAGAVSSGMLYDVRGLSDAVMRIEGTR